MVEGQPEAELDRLAEDFVARTRNGESPSISSYARTNPELAGEITDLFPLLLDLEGGRAPDAPPSHELGDYLLLREIGRGGMGVVYEAVQKTLGRRVALKILPKQMTLDSRFLERFRLEAQAAARLQHRNIVPVIGWGEHKGTYYYTMQFVDGCGLDEVLPHVRRLFGQVSTVESNGDSGSAFAHRMLSAAWHREKDTAKQTERLSTGRTYYDNVARLILQAAEGIAAAHAQGVLHRDVKPSNLMLDDKGGLWITDFGLCKETESGGLTQPGDLLGTFRYMAPERFEGVSDVQGDVYGLGITLYELLTREPAYKGDDRAAIAAQIVNQAPARPRKLDPKLPRDLELIVLKAIARDRSQRYATADALAADLRAYLERRPIAARPPTFGYLLRTTIRRHKPTAILGALAAIALVASTTYYVISLRDKESAARFGQYVANIAAAETAARDGDVQVARRLLDEAPPEHRNWEWHHLRSRLDRSLRSFERWKWPMREVAHSPDGRHLATCSAGSTRIHDERTGERLLEAQHRNHVEALAWHPNGRTWAVGTLSGLEVWSLPDAQRVVDHRHGAVRGVAYSRDGARLAYGGADRILRVVDSETMEESFSHRVESEIFAVAISPSGRFAACGTADAVVTMFDLTAGTRIWGRWCGRLRLRSLAFVADRLLVVPSSDGHVETRLVRSGGHLFKVLGHEQAPRKVAVSADGARLFTCDESRLHVWDTESGERLVTYGNDSRTMCGSFHPSGTRIVTGSNRGSVLEWRVPPVHDPDERLFPSRHCESLAFAPSGAYFVVGSPVMRLFDAQTREEIRHWVGHRADVISVCFSPDGQWAASSDHAGEVLVWHVPKDKLVHRLSVVPDRQRQGAEVTFSADSQRLFTCGTDGAVCTWSVATGERERRVVVSDQWLTAIAASPDGARVAVGEYFGKIHLLAADDLTLQHVCEGHESVVTDLAFQRGSQVLASANFDRSVRLWDAGSGRSIRTLRAFTSDSSGVADAMLSVSFLPDGSRIAAACADGSAKLWDTDSGRLVATLRGDGQGWMHAARFSPDAKRLVTLEAGGRVRAWETQPLRDRIDASPPDPSERARRDDFLARGSKHGLVEQLWHELVREVPSDPVRRDVLRAISRDLAVTLRQRGARDLEVDRLYALAVLWCGQYDALTTGERLGRIAADKGRADLRAIDLATLVIAFASQGNQDDARAWLKRLEDHLEEHPSARKQVRVMRLLAEARARID